MTLMSPFEVEISVAFLLNTLHF